MKIKTYLFIDGSNLYAGQYDLFGPENYLDFSKFIGEVEKRLKVKFYKIFFYASYSPKPKYLTQKAKQYLKNEALFYRNVKTLDNLTFFNGYRSKTSGKEKEVDVKLAVDIVNFAHLRRYDQAFLLSGDADFLHALFVAKELRKQVEIICLQNKILHKAAYYFKTTIFAFKKFVYNQSPKQKIKILTIPKNSFIKSIK